MGTSWPSWAHVPPCIMVLPISWGTPNGFRKNSTPLAFPYYPKKRKQGVSSPYMSPCPWIESPVPTPAGITEAHWHMCPYCVHCSTWADVAATTYHFQKWQGREKQSIHTQANAKSQVKGTRCSAKCLGANKVPRTGSNTFVMQESYRYLLQAGTNW